MRLKEHFDLAQEKHEKINKDKRMRKKSYIEVFVSDIEMCWCIKSLKIIPIFFKGKEGNGEADNNNDYKTKKLENLKL